MEECRAEATWKVGDKKREEGRAEQRAEGTWKEVHSCVITNFKNPDEFYLATLKMKEEVESLGKEMEKFRGAPPMKEDEFIASDFLIAYHKGRFWRATRVQGTPPHLESHSIEKTKTAPLLLVDRAEVVDVPLCRTYKVSKSSNLRRPDPLCFRANMSDVQPISGLWTERAITCFLKNSRREDLKVLQRGVVSGGSMPVELLFSESFTETPFSPARSIETTMSRKLLAEGHAHAKQIELEPEECIVLPMTEIYTSPKETFSIPDEFGPAVRRWVPPCIPAMSDKESTMTMIRVTYIDGSFQIYGHLKKDVNLLRSMRTYFSSIYDIEDRPEDSKDFWMPNEACLAKLHDKWYRAQVLEVSPDKKKVGIIYVDLGNVRSVKSEDLRVPHAFADKPMLAIRMVLDGIVPPNGDEFSERSIQVIENELVYWNCPIVKIVRSRLEIPTRFPLPVHLYLLQHGEEEWHNYGRKESVSSFVFSLILFSHCHIVTLGICLVERK